MKKSFIVLALTLGFATSANADWKIAAGYTNFSDSDDGFDLSLNAITLGAGYETISSDGQFSIMPEIRLGFGAGDDTIGAIKVEVDSFMALSIRGVYYATDVVYLYAQPSYGNLEVKASGFGESASDDEWDFGVGMGIGVTATDNLSLELTYENFDNTKVITGGVRYSF